MAGGGARWQATVDLFELHRRRLGYEVGAAAGTPADERGDRGPGPAPAQGSLFDA